MKTYISLGIGDAVCIDSLLTQEERNNISEIYWACRFGHLIAPLFDTMFYPNLTKHHFINEEVGRAAMCKVDANAADYWHFRPDFPESRKIGLELFGLNQNEVSYLDACAMLHSNRKFTNSSFLQSALFKSPVWEKVQTAPGNYILFHYPTSSRPRQDIATIDKNDWAYIENLSKQLDRKVVIISDVDIDPPLSNFSLHKDLTLKEIMSLCNYAEFYCGCDSFVSIACCKVLPIDKISIKSHNRSIQEEIKYNTYQQKYFFPFTGLETSKFYKPYLG